MKCLLGGSDIKENCQIESCLILIYTIVPELVAGNRLLICWRIARPWFESTQWCHLKIHEEMILNQALVDNGPLAQERAAP